MFWSPTCGAVRVGCDATHDTDTPTYFEVLGNFGTDVRRVGRLASGLWVDALKPGVVGAGGVALIAVGGDAAGGPLGAAVPSGRRRAPQTTVGVRMWRRS